MKYKLAPFYKRCLSFFGFSRDEQNHMEEVTIENGSYVCYVSLIMVCFKFRKFACNAVAFLNCANLFV